MPGNIVFRVGWRYLIRHPWQSGLLVLGILLGVAVMVAIDLANASASRAFDLSTDAISGRATHQIVGGSIGFDENLYIRLLRSENPPQMTPVVVEYVSSPQLGNRPFTLLGIDPFSEGPFRNYFGEQNEVPISQLAAMLARPGSVYLSVQVAERYGLVPCEDIFSSQDPAPDRCQITLDINGAQQTAYIAGLLQPVDTLTQQALDAVLLTDLSTAQEFTSKLGVLDRIDLILPETNPNQSDLTRELNDMLPENVDLQEVAARSPELCRK
jgi:putative ABC transport system permease protein